MTEQPLSISVDGTVVHLHLVPAEPLLRAVVISLFTWRRANPDDVLPGDSRMGWWGDTHPEVDGDRIGSRLWLLSRSSLTRETVSRAREYCEEALRWLIDDQVAAAIEVSAERVGVDRLGITVLITRTNGQGSVTLRFDNVWSFIHHAA